MLAMALLLHGGVLGGVGGEAGGVDGSGESAWTLATPAEGFLAASGTGELAHLLHLCLFRAFPRVAGAPWRACAPSVPVVVGTIKRRRVGIPTLKDRGKARKASK
eukprot:COSAG02_NODE_2427_length_8886_cov_8.409469_10_plen_105_part_00